MEKSQQVINASEIGEFCSCEKAYAFRKAGVEPENRAALEAGIRYHQAEGKRIQRYRKVRRIVWTLLLVALIVLIVLLLKNAGRFA